MNLVIAHQDGAADDTAVTVISIIERRNVPPQPLCERCDRTAFAQTAVGPRCEDHALADVRSTVDTGEWVPRVLRTRRSGVHRR